MSIQKFYCFGCTHPLDNTQLKWCSGCKQAYYCAEVCQRVHWKEHKAVCLQNRQNPAPPINDVVGLLKRCPVSLSKLAAIKQYILDNSLVEDCNFFSLIQIPITTPIFYQLVGLPLTSTIYFVNIDYTSMINVPSLLPDKIAIGLMNAQNNTTTVAFASTPLIAKAAVKKEILSLFDPISKLKDFINQNCANPNYFLIMDAERDGLVLLIMKEKDKEPKMVDNMLHKVGEITSVSTKPIVGSMPSIE